MSEVVYSTSFGIWKDLTGGSIPTPPSGAIYVIRDVEVYNGNTLSGPLLWVMEDTNTTAFLLGHQFNIGDGPTWQWSGRLVYPGPGALAWASSTAVGSAGVDVAISGYTLNAP